MYGISKFEMFSGGSRDISGVAAPTLTKESSVNRGDVIGLLMSGIYTRWWPPIHPLDSCQFSAPWIQMTGQNSSQGTNVSIGICSPYCSPSYLRHKIMWQKHLLTSPLLITNLQFGRLWRKTIFINSLTRTDRKSWKVWEENMEKEMILMMAWAWDLPTPVCVAAQKVVRARQ